MVATIGEERLTGGERTGEARLTGECLAERAAGGDAEAFQALWDRHRDRLRRVAGRGRWHDAQRHIDVQDILQETWLAAWRSIVERGYFRPSGPGSARKYLMQICRHKAQDLMRRFGRFKNAFVETEAPDMPVSPCALSHLDPRAGACQQECADVLDALICRLPDAQKTTVRLMHLHHGDTQRVAADLDVSRRTVQRNWKAARVRLQLWGAAEGLSIAA